MSNPTASALERVFACPDSHLLDATYATTKYAERGTEIARCIRNVVGGMSCEDAAKLVRNEAWRKTCLALDFRRLVGDLANVRGEVAYALDVVLDDVRELGSNLGRKYPPTSETEFVGTCDLEGERMDGVPVVIDVKSGQRVTDARENPQVMFFARVRQLLTKAPRVEGRLAYVSEDGDIDLDWHEFDPFSLEIFHDDLRGLHATLGGRKASLASGGRVVVASGTHCKYCPAMVACPRYTGLARTMLSDITEIQARIAAMTPAERGAAWEKARDIEHLVEHVIDGLKATARHSPIPLPGGKEVREMPWRTTAFDQQKAVTLLRTLGATDEQIASLKVTRETTQVRTGNVPGSGGGRRRRAA